MKINPSINIVGPNPELKSFSLLPPGKVPDMTLLHHENAHFDLIVSGNSRLAQNELIRNGKDTEETELKELKEKYETLKNA